MTTFTLTPLKAMLTRAPGGDWEYALTTGTVSWVAK
jgi:hypothetical protein